MDQDFAIVKIGGTQYKVSVGDQFDVAKLEGKKGGKVVFDGVLLTSRKGKVAIGTPEVKGAKVEAKILGEVKGKKIRVFKYKAKSRYRKTKGHRQKYTKIEITKV